MKVMLIAPPSFENYHNLVPPISLCSLSAVLKREGYDTIVVDACSYSWNKVNKIIKRVNPDVVGIPCLTIERGQSYKLAEEVRKNTNSIIMFGGCHPTFYPEHIFESAPVDFVVMGEGEETIIELMDAIVNKTTLKDIKGIAYKEDGKVIINERRGFIKDLDSIPFPDYRDIALEDYRMAIFKEVAIPLMTSRGCPFSCAFCSSTSYWEKYRFRSPENILREIEFYYKKGYKLFNILDDNFVVNKHNLIAVCKGLIDRNIKIGYIVSSNVRSIDDERLDWLKSSGCLSIGFGIESGCDRILKNLNKPQTKRDIEKAFELCKKYGIECAGSLIVGSPGEDEDSIKETAELMNKISPKHICYGGILWILPKTEIFRLAKEKGIITDSSWKETDKSIFYTVEHSYKELQRLQRLLIYHQRKKGYIKYFIWMVHLRVNDIIKRMFRLFYYEIVRFVN